MQEYRLRFTRAGAFCVLKLARAGIALPQKGVPVVQTWLVLMLTALAILVAVLVVITGAGWTGTRIGPGDTGDTGDTGDSGGTDGTGRISESETQPLPDVLVDPRVLVEKRSRQLTVFSADEPVKRYRIALGREPEGDKEREGDLRTPEGWFYVCARNPDSKYHRSIALSYPNEEDAERGLAAGLITKREHRTILDAMRHLTQPPWRTALGGEIMIHGGGAHSDWTEGCVAVSDAEAEELFRALPLGTPVEITP